MIDGLVPKMILFQPCGDPSLGDRRLAENPLYIPIG